MLFTSFVVPWGEVKSVLSMPLEIVTANGYSFIWGTVVTVNRREWKFVGWQSYWDETNETKFNIFGEQFVAMMLWLLFIVLGESGLRNLRELNKEPKKDQLKEVLGDGWVWPRARWFKGAAKWKPLYLLISGCIFGLLSISVFSYWLSSLKQVHYEIFVGGVTDVSMNYGTIIGFLCMLLLIASAFLITHTEEMKISGIIQGISKQNNKPISRVEKKELEEPKIVKLKEKCGNCCLFLTLECPRNYTSDDELWKNQKPCQLFAPRES